MTTILEPPIGADPDGDLGGTPPPEEWGDLATLHERSGDRGAVFTRPWVADLILGLASYDPEADLGSMTIVEPACGDGAFIGPIVQRLVQSCTLHGRRVADAASCVRAFDIDPEAVRRSRLSATRALVTAGVDEMDATRLAEAWIREADYLLVSDTPRQVDFVVGNPPYVRIEDVPSDRLRNYRERWQTMRGRADIYVGFMEAGLSCLRPDGVLVYICADRWMRNQYGSALRRFVEADYAMEISLGMHDVNAFEERVSAYPAIVRMRRSAQGSALVAAATNGFDEDASREFLELSRMPPGSTSAASKFQASWTSGWFSDQGSWPTSSPERLALMASLEQRLPLLEETGARVRVGVATGADDVFVVTKAEADAMSIEPSRLVPTVAARDLAAGAVGWPGTYLVNPWDENGLVEIDRYPRTEQYLRDNYERLMRRHVSKKRPKTWWRTIDRIDVGAIPEPKLLLPDLKDRIHPVLDEGRFYPMHSLYYLTSEAWDLRVLGGLLLSEAANLFVQAYSVRMANGYLRVSAQYLRRVRLPRFEDLSEEVRIQLADAFSQRDVELANAAALVAYGIDDVPS